MSRFVKLATGLRDLGNDINVNISKALNLPKETKHSIDPGSKLLEEARAGRVQGLEAIIQEHPSEADVNRALDPFFLSPLCLACVGGHEDAALFLLSAGADPNNSAGADAAAANATKGNPRDATSERLVAAGSPDSESFGSVPATPLMLAAEAGLQKAVAELVDRGGRVDARRAGDGWTALHVAADRGNALVMRSLLGAPMADLGMRTALLETPLSLASSKGHLAIVDMLLNEGSEQAEVPPDVAHQFAAGAASGSAEDGNPGRAVGVGVSQGKGPSMHAEERTLAGHTPLHRAAAHGHAEVILRLLSHGVRVDMTNAQGATPLILASRGGHALTAAALLKQGAASVNASTVEGDTALHAAAGISDRSGADVIRLLLSEGADVDARNALGSTALHLAAAAGNVSSVTALLNAGANPSATNNCGLTPGTCFLRPPTPVTPVTPGGAAAAAAATAANAMQFARQKIRRGLRKERRRHGQLRRLTNASAKRLAMAEVVAKTAVLVRRFVDFASKAKRWDLDATEHRKRLFRLNDFRLDILSDAPCRVQAQHGARKQSPDLLLDMPSPEVEGRSSRAVARRRKAAAEALKGAEIALKNLSDWKSMVLAERDAVTGFLRGGDRTLAFSPGKACGVGVGDVSAAGHPDKTLAGEAIAKVVINDPDLIEDEKEVDTHASVGPSGRDPASSTMIVVRPPAPAATPVADARRNSIGGYDEDEGTPCGFIRALEALGPCVAVLEKAVAASASGDRLKAALDSMREHIRTTLIDLMDLELCFPGRSGGAEGNEGTISDAESIVACDDDDPDAESAEVTPLSSEDAGVLDTKVTALVQRLSGGSGAAGSDAGGGGNNDLSLRSLYEDGLRGAATASEAEVDSTERLVAATLEAVAEAVSGPFLWSLDDAYQRLTAATAVIRRHISDAKAFLGGSDSEEGAARAARGRLISIRQQAADEEDHREELFSKLRRRRRQAAGREEISSIEEEHFQVRAQLATLRSSKLVELKRLREMSAFSRFPELLMEHPDPTESTFRALVLSGVAMRDPDEWGDHYMASLAGSRLNQSGGAGDAVLSGWGGEKRRLAEMDGSAVVIVEVGCGDREAKRALVSTLLLLTPPLRRDSTHAPASPHSRDLARISAISLRGDCALLEVPVEGSLSARAWLTSTSRPSIEGLVASVTEIESTVVSERGDGWREEFQWEVWVIMLQALRGLVAVHALSDKAIHRAVCLENILVAAQPRSVPNNGEADGSDLAYGTSGRVAHGPPSPPRRFFRRAQLGPPAPAALARPAPESVAPEVLRGQPFSQAADMYAFGFALRLACCAGGGASDDAGAYGGDKNLGGLGNGGGALSVMGPEAGPPPGPSRDSLVQVLESMLASDPSRRCTAEQALSSDYFRVPPPRPSHPLYPLKWSPFARGKARHPSGSANASPMQPNWVAAAMSVGWKVGLAPEEHGGVSRAWWDSCSVVSIPPPQDGGTGSSAEEVVPEWAEVEGLGRRSLPQARLRALVRLQDRGRWLAFVCERDAALASAASSRAGSRETPTSLNESTVRCLFADPRSVVSPDTLATAAMKLSRSSTSAGSGRTSAATEDAESLLPVRDGPCGVAVEGLLRCSESLRFAAVALAYPPVTDGAAKQMAVEGDIVRTVAIVRAVTGAPEDHSPRTSTAPVRSSVFPGFENTAWVRTELGEDPFCAVDAPADDSTRPADPIVGLPSPTSTGVGPRARAGEDAATRVPMIGQEIPPDRLFPGHLAGLAQPTVDSVRTIESLRGLVEEQGPDGTVWAGTPRPGAVLEPVVGRRCADVAHRVYTLRQEACYAEYLATFSFPAHAT